MSRNLKSLLIDAKTEAEKALALATATPDSVIPVSVITATGKNQQSGTIIKQIAKIGLAGKISSVNQVTVGDKAAIKSSRIHKSPLKNSLIKKSPIPTTVIKKTLIKNSDIQTPSIQNSSQNQQEKSLTPLLDRCPIPSQLRQLTDADLPQLAEELRRELIDAVSVTGGHLGAGLGVIELTIAIHYLFDTPYDRLIWDVGHQAYPHKILTGRRDRIRTLRQAGGLSGFTRRSESEYDPFGTAHSSTSISAALGMAVARDLLDAHPRDVIAVIGDGAMSAGMAYEAMNNAGSMNNRLIVILNDNDMSIAPPVGAMSAYLSRVVSSSSYRSMRHKAKNFLRRLPKQIGDRMGLYAHRAEEFARGFVTGGTLFEELGFYYIGPIDGHNFTHLLPVLRNVRQSKEQGPVLIHVVTRKGHGYAPAESSPDKFHGVGKFDIDTGTQRASVAKAPTYTSVFGLALIKEAEKDAKIVAITAAMPGGTGVGEFAARFPNRAFDVGIAEQHAVTFAAGLATEGMKPFVALYSTFLQRAYDQVVHDVAIQSLAVRFAIDRAGLVGADGATHAGSFDIAYLAPLPNMVIMAAADEAELVHMVATQVAINDRPSALRYPRGEGVGVTLPDNGKPLTIGRGRIIREGSTIAILSLGTRLHDCLMAAELLNKMGISATVADARFAKPIDENLVAQLVQHHELLITIEEGTVGGFSSQVLHYLATSGRLDKGIKIRPMVLPDQFIDHDNPAAQYETAGLTARHIVQTAIKALGTKTTLPQFS